MTGRGRPVKTYSSPSVLTIITFNIPKIWKRKMDEWRDRGFFAGRSEALRQVMYLGLREFEKIVALYERETPDINLPKDLVRIPNGDGTYAEIPILRRLE